MRTLPKPAAASPENGEALPTLCAPMGAPATSPTPDAADKAGVTGGAPGVLPEMRNIPQPGVPATSAMRAPREVGAGEPEKPVRSFRVVAGPTGVPCVYDGARFTMNNGKVLTDAQYDIELLRKQGIQLEELRS